MGSEGITYDEFVEKMCKHKDSTYPFLGLAGETGEVLEQVKKAWRDSGMDWLEQEESRVLNIQDELGDVLWYVTRCAHVVGLSLWELQQLNMDKLYERAKGD